MLSDHKTSSMSEPFNLSVERNQLLHDRRLEIESLKAEVRRKSDELEQRVAEIDALANECILREDYQIRSLECTGEVLQIIAFLRSALDEFVSVETGPSDNSCLVSTCSTLDLKKMTLGAMMDLLRQLVQKKHTHAVDVGNVLDEMKSRLKSARSALIRQNSKKLSIRSAAQGQRVKEVLQWRANYRETGRSSSIKSRSPRFNKSPSVSPPLPPLPSGRNS